MKLKLLCLALATCLIASAVWLVRSPNASQAQEVPKQYRAAVDKGLAYLAKQQFKDGHWEGDGGKHPVAVTALAGMAFLMEGSTLPNGKHSANLRKAADWLMAQSKAGRDGLIFSGHASETDRYMHGHGLATQFLAWAAYTETDQARRKKLQDVVTRASQYIVKAQSTQGGWYKTSKAEGHDFDAISSTAIQIQALYMVNKLGIPVRGEAVASAGQAYLKTALPKSAKDGKADRNRQLAELAAALACRCCPAAHLDQNGLCTEWFKTCRTEIPVGRSIKFGRDEMTHYYCAQAVYTQMLNETRSGNAYWPDYRKAMFDHLQSSQKEDGSWPAPADSSSSISAGPVYATAVWCTVLQLDKRRHPLTEPRLLRTF